MQTPRQARSASRVLRDIAFSVLLVQLAVLTLAGFFLAIYALL